jgi:hypothetical protein
VRSAKAEQSPAVAAAARPPQRLICAGQTYLERLGILYSEEIRLTIVAELSMREMGPLQFYETIGGRSYDSVRRHFLKLVDYGWLRKVRTVSTGRGRPEALFRATEQAVIDTETWRRLPVSIRDALTVMLLEDMGRRLGEASQPRDARLDPVATFEILPLDGQAWCNAVEAVEGCFRVLRQEQMDAKIRLEKSHEQPILVVVNLAAFEAHNPRIGGSSLPKAQSALSEYPWTKRIGKVFADRINYAIVEELNRCAMTPAQLHATLGGPSSQGFLRRCRRLMDLGWAVNVSQESGGPLYGAKVSKFCAAAPNISEQEILERIPPSQRRGSSWEVFGSFIKAALPAVHTGTFNNRFDRHLTSSPMLLDRVGWSQVLKALTALEEVLDELKRDKIPERDTTSEAGFLVSSFEASFRKK